MIESFIIPMKAPKLRTLQELIELDKDNGYLKAGKKYDNAYFYKGYDNNYYLSMTFLGDETKTNLGKDYKRAMEKIKRVLEFYKSVNHSFGMVYDHINIIFPKKEGGQ